VSVLLVAAALLVEYSYVRALTYPGDASVGVRTVDWLRDHGAGPVVDLAENWWYSRRPASTVAAAPDLPVPPGVVGDVPAPLAPIGPHPAPGDGVWQVGPPAVNGRAAVYVTSVHPDPGDPNILAGIARFDQRMVASHLIAGTKEPERQPADAGQVPPDLRPTLVATFNSGFKVKGSLGGYFARPRLVRQLSDGAASLVVDDMGRASVAMWGRDVHLDSHVVAVRQNLSLIIDDGRIVPGLEANVDGRWGNAKNQLQYTWRSAIGVDAAGYLYYAAGNNLTLDTLTKALAATGVVRGMELDIHPNMVHLFLYRHDPAAGLSPMKLLDDMRGPATRYLRPDQRDFIAITGRQ
jgi:hypothetical protein